MKTNTQTIEQTGKIWKLFIALSVLGMLGGIVWISSAFSINASTLPPTALLLISFSVFIVAKFLAWWNHG